MILALVGLTATLAILQTRLARRHPTVPEATRLRFEAMVSHLPAVRSDPSRTVLLFGLSGWEYALDPRVLDAELGRRGQPVVSYNLSIPGILGSSAREFTYRLAAELGGGARFRAAAFEFDAIMYTDTLGGQGGLDYQEFYLPDVFFSFGMLAEAARREPGWAWGALVRRALPAFDLRRLGPLGHARSFVLERIGYGRLMNTAELREDPPWRLDTRGFSDWNRSVAGAVYDRVVADAQVPESWNREAARLETHFGVRPGFRWSEENLRAFEACVRAVAAISDRVVIVVPPYAPKFAADVERWMDLPGVLKRLEENTGARVVDLRRALPLKDGDFVDPTHLRKETMDRLATDLAKGIFP